MRALMVKKFIKEHLKQVTKETLIYQYGLKTRLKKEIEFDRKKCKSV